MDKIQVVKIAYAYGLLGFPIMLALFVKPLKSKAANDIDS